MFTNNQIDASDMPSVESLELTPLAPDYRMCHLLSIAFGFFIPLIIVSVVRFQPFFNLPEQLLRVYPFIAAGIMVLASLVIVYSFFADAQKGFALREHDLHYQSGLWFETGVTQPILRIQHIELKRSAWERLFGLASIEVFSAGGSSHTFEIPGLEYETAQQLRSHILNSRDIQHHG